MIDVGSTNCKLQLETSSFYWKSIFEKVPGIYANEWYNQMEHPWKDTETTQAFNFFRIGSPRLRQARTKTGGFLKF